MSERIQRRRERTAQPQREPDGPLAQPRVDAAASASDYDAILDEIDAVLESDAEDYVRGFVQKGGQ